MQYHLSNSIVKQQQIKKQQISQINSRIKPYKQLIQLDPLKYQLQKNQKNKVKEILKDKKQKQKQKKRRIKLLQEQFERKRLEKIQELQNKTKNSTKNKQTVTQQKLKKNKKSLQHAQKIHQKVNQQHFQNIQKVLTKRKQFYSTDLQSLENHKNKNATPFLNLSRSRQTKNNFNIQNEMKKIQQKLQKAKNNQKNYKKQLLNKFSQRDRHNLSIQQKIRINYVMDQQKIVKQVYGKSQQILQAQKKVKNLTTKHLETRRKTFQDKIQKLHQNIQLIQNSQQQKYHQLQEKFNKQYAFNPIKRSITDQTHRQRILLNQIKLEEQKKIKAQYILKKHAQITAKNHIYKEKKDKILQVIKKSNPQQNIL